MKFIIEYEAHEVLEILEKEPEAKFFSESNEAQFWVKVDSSGYQVVCGEGYVENSPLKDLLNLSHRRFIRENDPNVPKLGV
jgi:hypothetical protein